jgi:ELWxxDGT repeat protein
MERWPNLTGGTYRVKDIAAGAKSSRIFDMTAVGNLV